MLIANYVAVTGNSEAAYELLYMQGERGRRQWGVYLLLTSIPAGWHPIIFSQYRNK